MVINSLNTKEIINKALLIVWKNLFYLAICYMLYILSLTIVAILAGVSFALLQDGNLHVGFVFLPFILVVILIICLNIGMTRIILGLVDGSRLPYISLFNNFSLFLPYLLSSLIVISPVLIAIFIIYLITLIFDNYLFMLLLIPLFIPAVYLSLRLIFSPLLIIDTTIKVSVKKSLNSSWIKTEGNLLNFFTLSVWSGLYSSFFYILIPIVFMLFMFLFNLQDFNIYILLLSLILIGLLSFLFFVIYISFELICLLILYRALHNNKIRSV